MVECPLLKPNWWSERAEFSSKCSISEDLVGLLRKVEIMLVANINNVIYYLVNAKGREFCVVKHTI